MAYSKEERERIIQYHISNIERIWHWRQHDASKMAKKI